MFAQKVHIQARLQKSNFKRKVFPNIEEAKP